MHLLISMIFIFSLIFGESTVHCEALLIPVEEDVWDIPITEAFLSTNKGKRSFFFGYCLVIAGSW